MYFAVLSKLRRLPYDAREDLLNAVSVEPKNPPTRLPKRKALKLLQAGLTQTETAKRLGVSRCTVNRFVQTLNGELQQVEHYRSFRGSALTSLQMEANRVAQEILRDERMLSASTVSEKARLLDTCMRTLGIAYDKERLELGKSTGNFGLAGLVSYVHENGLFTKEELVAGKGVSHAQSEAKNGTARPEEAVTDKNQKDSLPCTF